MLIVNFRNHYSTKHFWNPSNSCCLCTKLVQWTFSLIRNTDIFCKREQFIAFIASYWYKYIITGFELLYIPKETHIILSCPWTATAFQSCLYRRRCVKRAKPRAAGASFWRRNSERVRKQTTGGRSRGIILNKALKRCMKTVFGVNRFRWCLSRTRKVIRFCILQLCALTLIKVRLTEESAVTEQTKVAHLFKHVIDCSDHGTHTLNVKC